MTSVSAAKRPFTLNQGWVAIFYRQNQPSLATFSLLTADTLLMSCNLWVIDLEKRYWILRIDWLDYSATNISAGRIRFHWFLNSYYQKTIQLYSFLCFSHVIYVTIIPFGRRVNIGPSVFREWFRKNRKIGRRILLRCFSRPAIRTESEICSKANKARTR